MDPVSPPTPINPLKQFLLGLPESSVFVRVVILPDFSAFPWFWTLPFAWNSLFSKFWWLNNLCSSHVSLDATVPPASKYYGSSMLFFLILSQEVSSTSTSMTTYIQRSLNICRELRSLLWCPVSQIQLPTSFLCLDILKTTNLQCPFEFTTFSEFVRAF